MSEDHEDVFPRIAEVGKPALGEGWLVMVDKVWRVNASDQENAISIAASINKMARRIFNDAYDKGFDDGVVTRA